MKLILFSILVTNSVTAFADGIEALITPVHNVWTSSVRVGDALQGGFYPTSEANKKGDGYMICTKITPKYQDERIIAVLTSAAQLNRPLQVIYMKTESQKCIVDVQLLIK